MKSIISKIVNEKTDLGVEWDYPSVFKILKAYFNLKWLYPDKRIRVHRSSRGHGIHFEVEGVKNNMEVRRWLGECPGRLRFSEIRENDNVLFHSKKKPSWRKWRNREEVDPRSFLSLPFFSHVPRGYYRRRFKYVL